MAKRRRFSGIRALAELERSKVRRIRRSLLEQKEANLLSLSHVTQGFPIILSIIDKYGKVTHTEEQYITQQERDYLKDMVPRLVKEAQSEWQPVKDQFDYKEAGSNCELCGTPIKYLYYITNIRNGNSMVIGSECIKIYFDNIRDQVSKDCGSFGKWVRKRRSEAEKIFRIEPLLRAYPGATGLPDKWKGAFDNYLILLPPSLRQEFNDIYGGARELLKRLDENPAATKDIETIIEQFGGFVEQHKQFTVKAEKYVEENKGKEHVVTRDMKKWLEASNPSVIKELKTGFVDADTFHLIGEPKYLRGLIPKVNQSLSSTDFQIESVLYQRGDVYGLKHKPTGATVACMSAKILPYFAGKIFGFSDEPVRSDYIAQHCRVQDPESMAAVVSSLIKRLASHNLQLRGVFEDFDTFIVVNNRANTFKPLKLRDFVKKYSAHALYQRKPDINILVSDLTSIRWLPIYEDRSSTDEKGKRRIVRVNALAEYEGGLQTNLKQSKLK